MMKFHRKRIALLLILSFLAAGLGMGCGPSSSSPFPSSSVQGDASRWESVRINRVVTELPSTRRETFEMFKSSELEEIEGNLQTLKQQMLQFSVETYSHLFPKAAQAENRLFAPVGLYTILAWLSERAEGETKTALMQGLQAPSAEPLQKQMAILSRLSYSGEEGAFLNANSLWMDRSVSDSLDAEFLRISQEIYRSDLFSVDFSKPESGEYMSQYVDHMSGGLLQHVPAPKSESILSLLNVFYFTSEWAEPFVEELTKDATFTDAVGKTSEVPFMHRQFQTEVLHAPQFDAIDLYMKQGRMRFVLPQEQVALSELTTPATLRQILNGTPDERFDLDLRLPRFEIQYEGSLLEGLSRGGMGGVFASERPAMFQILKDASTEISDILQGCCLKVAERRVEAAAYTRADVKASCAMSVEAPALILEFNRPFLVILYSDEDLPLLIAEVRQVRGIE